MISDAVDIMGLPLIACTLLAGIHGYVGLHVVQRGVIFVDIALAQMAALGAALAVVGGSEIDSPEAIGLSVAFTLMGAALLASVRRLERWVPAEAFIGVVYVVGAALVILLMDQAAHGSEHVKELLVGQILWVTPRQVAVEAVVYGAVGLAFGAIHRSLAALSAGESRGWSPRRVFLFDMLFYALFGLVVTISVRIAGVLLVFTYLVVPAMIAFMTARGFARRMAICWTTGVLISLAGVTASYGWDVPTGAAIVAAAGVALAIVAVARVLIPETGAESG